METVSRELRTRRRPLVGAQVRKLRTDRGLTLAQVGERTGLNVGYLSQVETDKASPSLETLAAIADSFDVPIAWLLMDAAPPPRATSPACPPPASRWAPSVQWMTAVAAPSNAAHAESV